MMDMNIKFSEKREFPEKRNIFRIYLVKFIKENLTCTKNSQISLELLSDESEKRLIAVY